MPSETSWKSIYLAGVFALIQSSQYSIFFSSLWPYLKSLDPKFSENALGFVIATYSVAQVFSAPIFGYWSNKINQTKIPLLAGFILMAIGNFLHFWAQIVPVTAIPYFVGVSRFITGLGSGNSGLLRTHASNASRYEDRSRAMSFVQGGLALGIMMGPVIQLLFSPLSEEGYYVGFLNFSIYTAPAALLVFLNLLGAFLVVTCFRDALQTIEPELNPNKESEESYWNIGLIICILSNFSHIFTLTVIETIASPYTIMMFGFTKRQAITTNSAAHGTAGTISAVIYVIFIVFNCSRRLPERMTTIICQLMMLALFLLTFSYPREYLGRYFTNTTVPYCDSERFDWCSSLTPTNIWLFYACYILVVGLAFAFITIVVSTLYSKMIGDRKQGTLQGIYQMAGSAGRLIAPLLVSNIYSEAGPRAVWALQIIEISAVLILWIVFYRKLVP